MKKLLICIIVLLISQTVSAQTGSNAYPPEGVMRAEEIRIKSDQMAGRNSSGMINQPSQRPVYDAKRIEAAKKAKAETEEEIKEINKKFSPSAEYYAKYANLLKRKNTGIARMFPDKNCGEGKVVDVKELERCGNTPEIKGAGSRYSFRLSTIPYMPLQYIQSLIGQSDMHFVGDKLLVGTYAIQDIISEIGEVDVDKVDSSNEAVKFLSNLKADKNVTGFESRRKDLKEGINSGGYLYSDAAPVKLNKTYALRSIAYRRGDWQSRTFMNTDILVVFKIVGLEQDGSIIMLWKMLKRKNAPMLENK